MERHDLTIPGRQIQLRVYDREDAVSGDHRKHVSGDNVDTRKRQFLYAIRASDKLFLAGGF